PSADRRGRGQPEFKGWEDRRHQMETGCFSIATSICHRGCRGSGNHMIRRRPKPDAIPEPLPACPNCVHKVSDHNQFGCCFTEEVCTCLMSPAKIAEHNESE